MKNKKIIRLLKITGSFVFISGLVCCYVNEFYTRFTVHLVGTYV